MANNTGIKFGGRKKGTPNRITKDIKKSFKTLIENNLQQLTLDLKALEPFQRVQAILKLSEFVLPKAKDFNSENELYEMQESEFAQEISNLDKNELIEMLIQFQANRDTLVIRYDDKQEVSETIKELMQKFDE